MEQGNALLENAAKGIRVRPVAELVPYARNARTHSAAQIDQLARSIQQFGFTNPVLVHSDGTLIAGHGRVMAAKQLGIHAVPTIDVDWMSDEQRRAYILADNQLALNAGWDEDLLAQEMADLRGLGFDLTLLGFADARMDELLANVDVMGAAEKDPDGDVPPLEREAHTRLGDVWALGPHRLICGDATDASVVATLMAGGLAHVAWTDPPYNVAYKTAAGSIKNDDLSAAAFRRFLIDLFIATVGAMREGASIYVAHADSERMAFEGALVSAGFKISANLIWRKGSLVLGRSDYQWAHEPILYGWKEGKRHRWFGGRKQTTVAQVGEDVGFHKMDDGRWQIAIGDSVLIVDGEAKLEELVPSVTFHAKPTRSSDHPTMKPVALIERMLRNSARPGEVVLDLCAGSGSTLIADHRLGMSARVAELEPRYCDVIVRRWQEYTGLRAAHGVTGAAFPD